MEARAGKERWSAMDGGEVTSRIEAGLRRAGALTLVSLAMVPLALMSFGDGARADEPPSSVRFAVGSPAMLAAQDLARRTWGTDPCGGVVDVSWGTDDPSINARSYWANPQSAYDAPELNVQCRIVFNALLSFDWPKFCTVLVHEYGHLAGHPHSADGPDVMSPIYRAPLASCAAMPDPTTAAAPPPPPPAPPVVDAPANRGSSTASAAQKAKQKRLAKARAKAAKAKTPARARAAELTLRHFDSASG
jgi:hypothetical protein